jgi:hypothetical protein
VFEGMYEEDDYWRTRLAWYVWRNRKIILKYFNINK